MTWAKRGFALRTYSVKTPDDILVTAQWARRIEYYNAGAALVGQSHVFAHGHRPEQGTAEDMPIFVRSRPFLRGGFARSGL